MAAPTPPHMHEKDLASSLDATRCDAFRLRFRLPLHLTVFGIVAGRLSRVQATALVAAIACGDFRHADQQRFVATIEAELAALHAGNCARYRLTPAQVQAWREGWDAKETR